MPTAPPSSRPSFDRVAPWVAGALLFATVGCSKPSTATSSASFSEPAGVPRLEMRGNVLFFEGRPMRLNDRLETWTNALGPPTTSPSDGGSGRFRWDALGIWTAGPTTPDGRTYVSSATVRMGEGGFPGVFVLQGVPLLRNRPPLKDVQSALAASETPLVGLGRGRLPESAKMHVHEPDGFEVTVAAKLDCTPPGADCVQSIEELEIDAAW
jgi:hypothetical protein